jgi:type IX secretion system PorP/SprF family membrane protein
MNTKYLIILILTLIGEIIFAQDMHFSHLHSSPTHINPAYTGIYNGNVRVVLNYKNQWSGIGKYNTAGFSSDFKVARMRNRDFFSMGLGFYFDNAGDLNWRTYNGNLQLAYTKSLSRKRSHGVTLGLYAGVIHQSYDFSRAKGFDVEPLNGIYKNSVLTYDAGLGVSWFMQIGKHSQAYAGYGLHHINKPNVSTRETLERLFMRHTVNVGFEIASKSRHALLPSFYYAKQGMHQEILLGTFYRFEINNNWKDKNQYFYFGAWARFHVVPKAYDGIDAVIASIRYDHFNWKFTFSYDINVSLFSSATQGKGGPELSIIYIHQSARKDKNKVIYCPKF